MTNSHDTATHQRPPTAGAIGQSNPITTSIPPPQAPQRPSTQNPTSSHAPETQTSIMDLRSLARPLAQLLTTARRTPLTPQRGHKTTARTKRALKIAPHDSFLPDRTAPPAADTIIYNPPASEASPAHTPFIFLPPSDPRKSALLRLRNHPGAPAPGALPRTDADLPPQMRYKHRNPRYNLREEDVAEMRRLRAQDPIQWSVGKLAQKFDCSEVFVKMAAPASKEHHEWLKAKLDRKTARWGPKKTQAREDRRRRAELVYRGEL